jgi:serine/threonine-protein kinase RsbW
VINEQTFPSDPTSLAKARRFVLDSIDDASSVSTEAVSLMVSELTTNAVRHTSSPRFKVTVENTGTAIRVAVTDYGTGEPVLRAPAPGDLSGRGLHIVHTLAADWGIIPAPHSEGKTVWFALPITPADGGEHVSVQAEHGDAAHIGFVPTPPPVTIREDTSEPPQLRNVHRVVGGRRCAFRARSARTRAWLLPVATASARRPFRDALLKPRRLVDVGSKTA